MSVLDQGIFSSANFILSVILARWLSTEQFGAYAIGFTILTFVYQFYLSFLLDPMGVLGPTYFPDNLEEYFVTHLKSHFVITIIVGLLITVVSFVWTGDQPLLKDTLFVLGITLPLSLLPWYFRRVFYILGRPVVSLWGSLVYAVSLVILTMLLRYYDILSSSSAVMVTAIAGLVSGFFLSVAFQFRKLRSSTIPLAVVVMQDWEFGKWLILSSVLIAFASQVQIWISARFLGLYAPGVLRALQVLTQPMMLTITALIALATPALSFDFSKRNFADFKRKIFLLSGSLLILAIFFEALLLAFNAPIEMVVYAGKFSNYAPLLPVWGIIPLSLAYSSGIQAGLQAARKPRAFLIAAIFWVPASLGLGIWLTSRFGIWGATWSTTLGYGIFVLALSILYWRSVHRLIQTS